MTSLADELAALSPEERRLLELTLREKGIEISKYRILPRSEPQDSYPVSWAQRRLWFVHQVDPKSPAYHVSNPLRLRGRLDPAVLERAVDALVERHEALRTTFAARGGEPVQVVHPAEPRALPRVDLGRLGRQLREREARLLADSHFRRPFDLEHGPLMRTCLLHLGEETPVPPGGSRGAEHVLLLTVHHVVVDGWSLGIFFRELTALYQAFSRGEPSPLPPLPIQYADFAVWQRDYLRGETEKELDGYWTKQLAGLPDELDLPFDRPRPELARHRSSGAVPVAVPRGLLDAVRELARREQATPFVVTLAAFQALLARVAGQTDVVVGSPIAGRNREEVEGLIGFFVNTSLLRLDLSGRPSFAELVHRAARVAAEASAHQDMPFERLVGLLAPERTLNRMPLYQVGFSFQAEPGTGLRVEGLELAAQESERPMTLIDLSLVLTEAPDGLRGHLLYDADLFDKTTVQRLARAYPRLLACAVHDPERLLTDLPAASAAENHQVCFEWSPAEPVERAPVPLLHRLVEDRADQLPDDPAVVCGDVTLSFRELDRQANRLAHRLRELGVGPETVVGLSVDRSIELVPAILGILKSGGAYLPLDPAAPAERVAFMLDDVASPPRSPRGDAQSGQEPRVAVVGKGLLPELPSGVERLELGAPETLRQPSTRPPSEVRAGNTAYVIYTSGSTGTPKGVAVAHGEIADRVWYNSLDDLRPGDAFLQRTSFTFDVSLVEIFSPLAAGCRTVLPRPGAERDLDELDRLIRGERLTHISFPPSTLDLLLKRRVPATWGHVKVVSTGGETVPAELPGRFHAQLGGVRLVNRYGPTETTVSMLAWPCRAGETAWSLPLGRAVAQSRIHVLDGDLRPVPIRVAGELVIGGGCLARGYLRRPGKTAEVFVPDPLGESAGARLYRSGDLGRFRSDGAVEFLGRIDRQVKVRGFRVELGEIEAVLRQHPAVADAAVAGRKERAGTVRLDGYLVPASGTEPPGTAELREWVGGKLPAYMVPATFTPLSELPYLASGKVDRRALPEPTRREPTDAPRAAPRNEIELALAAIWCEVLELDAVGIDDNFFDLGGHSLLLIGVQTLIEERLERKVAVLDLFRYPTIADLAGFLGAAGAEAGAPDVDLGRQRAEARRGAGGRASSDVAVVAMACRFPGARDTEEFWDNLKNGVESIRRFSTEELVQAGLPRALVERPDYVKAFAVLDEAEWFDAALFDMSPREAQVMDPQQRLFLECAWEALERAGYDSENYDGAVGVFGGVGASHNWVNLMVHPQVRQAVGELQIAISNEKDFLPTQTSYRLDLRGPSVNVQTACSTSLVAAHLACQSLLGGECDMALAGGVTAIGDYKAGYLAEEGGVSAPDAHTYTFDARAAGTGGGHGAGVVVLKRLDAAIRDRDPIHAVIRGSAINNDGSVKVGFTAPSIAGQARVVAEAQAVAGVAPESVTYVEAHGTATPLGDPIEVAALKEVFGTEPGERCALGSVKTNFGHLSTAAGVAGLIKTVLALEHRQIPPSLHFERPNPEIDFESSPFYVNTALRDWTVEDGGPRRAGVSSFGLGGTNAHLVLEEPPAPAPSGPSRPWKLLVQSAKTETALEAATDRLEACLGRHSENDFADVAYTLQVGRRRLPVRQVLVSRGTEDAATALRERDVRRLLRGTEERKNRGVAFLLPGVGDHYPGMGRGLYETEPAFRHEVDRAADLLLPHLGVDLREVLYPEDGEPRGSALDMKSLLGRNDEPSPLDRTLYAQPAVFVVEYALARLLEEWGVRPEALLGYSLGEYTAACLAGVFSPEDALALVADRARWIDELPAGGMTAVLQPPEEVLPHLGAELSLAASNAPSVSVVAGPEQALAELEEKLGNLDVAARRLKSTHAFHSKMMEPLAERLADRVREIDLSAPRVPYLSNVTGTWITREEALDPEYWARHLCRTVRFAEGVETLLGDGGRILLEVGPGQALATSVRQHPARTDDSPVISSMRDGREGRSDVAVALESLGRLWIEGAAVDWKGFSAHEDRRRLELAPYPFERKRYWIEPRSLAPVTKATREKKPDVADWFYVPSWKLSTPPPPLAAAEESEPEWLVFEDEEGLGTRVAELLRDSGRKVTSVRAGTRFRRSEDGLFEIDPGSPEHYGQLLSALEEEGRLPARIGHFRSVTSSAPTDFEAAQTRGLYSLFSLCRALIEKVPPEPVTIALVSNGVQRVDGREELSPEKSTVLGAMRVIPQEYRDLACRSVDVALPVSERRREELAGQLAADLASNAADLAVAWRSGGRFIESFEAVRVPEASASAVPLRERGVYLVTGGLGNVGLALADFLARRYRARLVLTGRSAFPEPSEWDTWLDRHDEDDATSRKIRLFRSLEEAGAEILVTSADASDKEAMASVVEQTLERFGELHGVVHLAGAIREGLRVPVEETGPEDCRRHASPKVRGLSVLEEVLEDVLDGRDLDFCYLFSSLATVLGGLGFGAYTAANAYLDAFAVRKSASSSFPWISADWDGWPLFSEDPEDQQKDSTIGAMRQCEAVEAFRRVLSLPGSPRVVVATADLNAQMEAWLESAETGEADGESASPQAERPRLRTAFVAPSGETEEVLAEIWQELLGFSEIGVHDNYFELGGDSLLATRMLSTVRRRLRVQLTLRHLFDNPTVSGLASVLESSEEDSELARLEALLTEVEEMPLDEVGSEEAARG